MLPDYESNAKAEAKTKAVATTNACKLCTPLGACLAFRGIEGAIPFIHGSQGCATYIRRYLISHFKEPMDIASSSIDETSTIFGGGQNFKTGLKNVCNQYHPKLIGVATSCLSETIGDDVQLFISEYLKNAGHEEAPAIVRVSTPSYKGMHIDGFHNTVAAVVQSLSEKGPRCEKQVNVLPGMVSPADLRHLKEITADFGLECIMLPDYSETLDGPIWDQYQKISPGGTPVESIRKMGRSASTIQLGRSLKPDRFAGDILESFNIPCYRLGLPIGVHETDRLVKVLEAISGKKLSEKYAMERGRLIDAYVDGHKYVFEKRAILYGEPDLVIGLASFLAEIGVIPVLCATGSDNGHLAEIIPEIIPETASKITVREGLDFQEIANLAVGLEADFMIGNSKGQSIARSLDLPLIRAGFPIHDRVGGGRILHLGYRGAQQLFDTIANTLIARKQDASPVGYSYM